MRRPSSEFFSLANQAINTGSHLIVFDEFATIRLRDSAFNCGNKSSLILQHPLNSIRDELLNVFSVGERHFLQASFHVGREVNFHAPIMALLAPCHIRHTALISSQ